MENRTGPFTNVAIWFGVAISVSEIMAGVQIESMSATNSIWLPLILGHLLGGILLFLVGYIGAKLRLNAMETIKSTFGNNGYKFFAALNVLQLIAWVAVLNSQGAAALMGLNLPISFPLICIILALLIAIWVYVGVRRSSKITNLVMVVLTILLAILTLKLMGNGLSNGMSITGISKTLGFWNIFEISIAMPISWLPVISDYTKDVERPIMHTALSAAAYTIASLWMYFIGVEIVGLGTTDIAQAILMTGLGIQGIIILALSTVTSNFIAANSAGESAKAIFNKIEPKTAGVAVSILSAILAISGIMNHYISFLYLISSVFAPMAAVLLVSFYLSKESNENVETSYWKIKASYWNMFAWLAGFIIYQIAVNLNSIFLGPTLLAILTSAILAYLPILKNKINKS